MEPVVLPTKSAKAVVWAFALAMTLLATSLLAGGTAGAADKPRAETDCKKKLAASTTEKSVTAKAATKPDAGDRVNPVAQAFHDFGERTKKYAELHDKAAKEAPKLKDKAEPEEIARHQEALREGIRAARAGACPGDLFTSDVEDHMRKLVREYLKHPIGKDARAVIQEDKPVGGVPLKINADYPSTKPVSTVPPGLLQQMPPLPEELEYRFVGRALVLRDRDANLIADFMPNVLPAK